jgi:hypothetical protein
MFNPLTPIIAEQHRDKLLEEATKKRALVAVRKTGHHLRERLCVGIGGFLISSGLRLQAPYQPALPARPETLQPGR